MQRKFSARFFFKAARIFILSHYWDLKVEQLHEEVSKAGNKKMIELCERIMAVP